MSADRGKDNCKALRQVPFLVMAQDAINCVGTNEIKNNSGIQNLTA